VAWRRIVHANRQHDQEIDDMSPLFGHKDRQAAKDTDDHMNATLQAELDRLGSLSIEDLAAEVMVKGFGPGGPGQDDDHVTVGQQNANSGPDVYDIAHVFVDYGGTYLYGTPSPEEILWRGILKLVAEGLQELEHASLIRMQMHTSMGSFDYAATRRGRAALERGDVQQILAGRAPVVDSQG
jgi:hypothetical protein